LFEADGPNTSSIYEFTPGGARSTFASEASWRPAGLAFNSTGDLFMSDMPNGIIYEFTPSGVPSIFAWGLVYPSGLAFNSVGDLFVADGMGNIFEFTPGGTCSTFASGSGLYSIYYRGLAFDSSGNLFEADAGSGNIYEFTPDGVQSTFASGLNHPAGLAFQSVPEPVTLLLLGLGGLAIVRKRR
jgi:DNA-binding beta-propeller fold protein YncE